MPNQTAVVSPLSGATLKAYPVPSGADIAAAMASSRQAFPLWAATPLSARIELCKALAGAIVRNTDALCAAITACTGKPPAEALMADVYPSLDILQYYIRHAAAILKTKKRKTPFLFAGTSSYVEYRPYGTALVIAPWNLPFQLAVVPVFSAALAGNTVILKPSQYTLTIGEMIVDLFAQAGFPGQVVACVYGGGETGRMLIEANPDKIFFTGSLATGKQVMAAAAAGVIPVELELGGKDPMIVFDDAHLERAAAGAVYGAFANAGQVCVSVERLYVQESAYDRFLALLKDNIDRLRVGSGFDDDIGAMTTQAQIEIVKAHIDDAVQKGATPHTKLKIDGNFVYPVLLSNVNHAMKVMREETFGPVLPVMRFTTEEEAVRLANDTDYGLNASVWTRDIRKGKRVAAQIQAGNCAVNDVLKNIGNPALPFGGVKKSGFGRYHAEDGLYAFSQPVSITVNSGAKSTEINWFPFSRALYDSLKTFMEIRYGTSGIFRKAAALIAALPRLSKNARK